MFTDSTTLRIGDTVVKVRRLTLGGVRKEGVVSAATDPDYIGGIGKLEIVPSGSMLSFR